MRPFAESSYPRVRSLFSGSTPDPSAASHPSVLEERLRHWLATDLKEIAQTWMPFGKFGPDHFPPRGVPLYDLPVEYLLWFERKGFPKGRLGELMRMVHQLKVDGCDEVFDEIRRQRGGRTSLRQREP